MNLYGCNILILCGQKYGSGLDRHGLKKARRGLGPSWATVFTLRAGTARPKDLLGFAGPNPFGTAPPDPRLESGVGAVPNRPLICLI